jgi:hypothetical protein
MEIANHMVGCFKTSQYNLDSSFIRTNFNPNTRYRRAECEGHTSALKISFLSNISNNNRTISNQQLTKVVNGRHRLRKSLNSRDLFTHRRKSPMT